MANRLKGHGIDRLEVDSTGMNRVALFEVLGLSRFEAHLVNPRTTRHIRGRKFEVLARQWLCQLMSYGLLPDTFRPTHETWLLRSCGPLWQVGGTVRGPVAFHRGQ